MKFRYRIAIGIILIALTIGFREVILAIAFYLGITEKQITEYSIYLTATQIAILSILGIWIASTIAEAVRIYTYERLGRRSIALSNAIKYLGYIIVLILVTIPLYFGSSALLASSALVGLVLGLALQPVLGSFFAGLLIMITGFVSPGDEVRILSSQIPYSAGILPSYKYFSADYIEAGFKGTVIEIGLFYSKILTDSMRELKIPNSLFLQSAVVEYSSKSSDHQIINLRVEFPLQSLDLDKIEELIKNELKEFEIAGGPYFNEQSDKDHLIILVRLKVSIKDDWREIKSRALKKLLKLRKNLMDSSKLQ